MHTDEEEWRRVPEFPAYEVSSLGRVRSWINSNSQVPRLLKTSGRKNGYQQVGMVAIPGQPETAKNMNLHSLVAEVFLGPRPGDPRLIHVCHNDGDKHNNRADNLRYDTAKANHADSLRHGTNPALRFSRRTHCMRGHEYTPENTRPYVNNLGSHKRICRACERFRVEAKNLA